MAVTWVVRIDVLDLAKKLCRFTYTRTDDLPETTWTHTLDGIVDTANLAAMRKKLTDQVWAVWSAYAAKEAAIKAVVPAWETALQADITARESE